jgi:hypothetical protein
MYTLFSLKNNENFIHQVSLFRPKIISNYKINSDEKSSTGQGWPMQEKTVWGISLEY